MITKRLRSIFYISPVHLTFYHNILVKYNTEELKSDFGDVLLIFVLYDWYVSSYPFCKFFHEQLCIQN